MDVTVNRSSGGIVKGGDMEQVGKLRLSSEAGAVVEQGLVVTLCSSKEVTILVY